LIPTPALSPLYSRSQARIIRTTLKRTRCCGECDVCLENRRIVSFSRSIEYVRRRIARNVDTLNATNQTMIWNLQVAIPYQSQSHTIYTPSPLQSISQHKYSMDVLSCLRELYGGVHAGDVLVVEVENVGVHNVRACWDLFGESDFLLEGYRPWAKRAFHINLLDLLA